MLRSINIIHGHMAAQESGIEVWGSRDLARGHRLREVTRFTGAQLGKINGSYISYLRENPTATQDEVVSSLGGSEKGIGRVSVALDVLNQLDLVGRNGAYVEYVIVREDIDSTVEDGKSGSGNHHLLYEIDWIKKPDRQSIEGRKREGEKYASEQRQRAADEKYERLKPIEDALIYKVDTYWFGKPYEKSPMPLSHEECEDILARAIEAEIMRIERSEDGEVVFTHHGYIILALGIASGLGRYHVKIDLDNGLVDLTRGSMELKRYINPDFVNFLRKKKVELEPELTS